MDKDVRAVFIKKDYEFKCFERNVYYKKPNDTYWTKTGKECI